MSIKERHLVERYLQGELSGIELEDFKSRLSSDEEFKRTVDLRKIIYSGIQLAREKQLEKKILSSLKYRKPTIPFALKLIITFLVITTCFISLWFYVGKEFADNPPQRHWFSFLGRHSAVDKNKTEEMTKEDNRTKSKQKVSEIKKNDSDSINTEAYSLDAGTEPLDETLNNATDTSDIRNTEEIIVKQDQLLISSSVPVIDKSTHADENSLATSASQKMNSGVDLPEPETKTKDYDVEFWVSPVNYKGYKMSKNKIILFGIEEPDAVKLYRVNDILYMSYLKGYYELEYINDFKPYQKLKESEIPKTLKNE